MSSYSGHLHIMVSRNGLYRRSSGIYVLRIAVPNRLQELVLQREIHLSTKTSIRSDAVMLCAALLLEWRSTVCELEELKAEENVNLKAIPGAGFIKISTISERYGIPMQDILTELSNENIPLVFEFIDQEVYAIDDLHEVDRQEDTDGYVVDSLERYGRFKIFSGKLKIIKPASTIAKLLRDGFADESIFLGSKRKAAYIRDPGVRVTADNLFILKLHANKLLATNFFRTNDEKHNYHSPNHLPPSLTQPSAIANRNVNPAHRTLRASQLVEKFIVHKTSSGKWKPEQRDKMAMICRTFVELTNDPTLEEINRDLLRTFELDISKLPARRDLAARKYATKNSRDLISFAAANKDQLVSQETIKSYMARLSEFFSWAENEQYFDKSPAEKIVAKTWNSGEERNQDKRHPFKDNLLDKIFSANWFTTGRGVLNKHGRYHNFRPYYYWLPLLGLFTGARIKELAQLYLDDFCVDESGLNYISISTFTEDKSDGTIERRNDKSLKNRNAKRSILLHQKLIELGLTSYVEHLRKEKHRRLFPELWHDEYKGYGKAAGAWFNERFLGSKLGITRDSTLSFHSFRHTFITAMNNLDIPENLLAQIAGHIRGKTETLGRYSHDTLAKQKYYMDNLSFKLPPIAKFDVQSGAKALNDALKQKTRNERDAVKKNSDL